MNDRLSSVLPASVVLTVVSPNRRFDTAAEGGSEPAAMADTLLRLQRSAAIGELVSEIAHEFNNVLQLIAGSTGFIKSGASAAEPKEASLERITDATRRGARLVSQLLGYHQRQKLHPNMLCVNDLLASQASLLEPLFGDRIQLVVLPEDGRSEVVGDSGALEQMVLNLCLNARDAMPSGGAIALGCRNAEIESGSRRAGPVRRPGRYVVVSVADCGSGIPESIQNRIFEPDFTTKPAGKGTGLGLFVVATIAAQHGGFVEVESKPGVGTRFDVYLPSPEPVSRLTGGTLVQVHSSGPPRRVRLSATAGERRSAAAL